MAHSGSAMDVAPMRGKRNYFGIVPVMSVSMPVLTLLSSRKPLRKILTDDRRVRGVLAAETPAASLVSMRVIVPVSVPPPTSTLLALTTRLQVEKVIVSPAWGP